MSSACSSSEGEIVGILSDEEKTNLERISLMMAGVRETKDNE